MGAMGKRQSFPPALPHFVALMALCYSFDDMDEADINRQLERDRKSLFAELGREISDKAVLDVMQRTPRELFVPSEVRHMAYQNIPLSIGSGQTISQPYMVARMTELLELRGDERALEVGTGSGYQAAILSLLLPRGHLYTVERDPQLHVSSKERLAELGYHNVTAEPATNVLGVPGHAPFDVIIVTAACPGLPESLVDQLAVNGRMAAPVGSREEQDLVLARRTDEGVSVRFEGKCRFVPLLGPEGFEEK